MSIKDSAGVRESAAEESGADRARGGSRLVAFVSAPMGILAASAVLAVVMGVALPAVALKSIFQEGGLVENLTVVVYAFAMVAIWSARGPHFDGVSAASVIVVLAACVAREIHLRRWIIEAGEGSFCCAREVSASLTVVVVVALALATVVLFRRHAAQVWRDLLRKRPIPSALFAIFCATVVSQFFDRLPALLPEQSLSMRSVLLALAIEETLELLIPVLVMVAALQATARNAKSR